MAPLVAQRRLNISTKASVARHLNSSSLYCVWRVPFQHHTMGAPHFHVHSLSTPSHGAHCRGPCHASAFQHVMTCRACAPGAPWRPFISPLYCSVLPWRPLHPGQLEPTTLPLRRLAPDSCSVGLSPTLSLSFSPALSPPPHPLSLSSPFLSHCVPLSLTLSLSLSHKRGFRDVRCTLSPPGFEPFSAG